MKKAVMLLIAMMIVLSSTCLANPYKLVEAEYIVQTRDSLDTITETYMKKVPIHQPVPKV